MDNDDIKFVNNYENYLKRNFSNQFTELINTHYIIEDLQFFFNLENFSKRGISKLKKTIIISLCINYNKDDPKMFLYDLGVCIDRFSVCYSNINSIKYYKEILNKEEDKVILDELYNNIFLNFKINFLKYKPKDFYDFIVKTCGSTPHKFLFKILVNSNLDKIDNSFPEKKFYKLFFNNFLKGNVYKNNIVLKKHSKGEVINDKINLCFHSNNKEIEKNILKEILKKKNTIKNIFLEKDSYYTIENIVNWDSKNSVFDKKFMIFENLEKDTLTFIKNLDQLKKISLIIGYIIYLSIFEKYISFSEYVNCV